MDFDDYQTAALKTWNPPPDRSKVLNLAYLGLGLGEVGEIQGKLKKIIRDDNSVIREDKRLSIGAEIGDALWYITVLATELGFSLEDIARENIDKLASRKERGVIQGSGDNR